MAFNVSEVIGGPAKVNLGGSDLEHTQGGISASITPDNRQVNVDEFGSSAVLIRHVGDQVTVTCPFAQYSATTIAEISESGYDQTAAAGSKYMGIGRSAGFVYTTQALKIIPLLAANAAKLLEIYKATATGAIELNYNQDDDTIFETEFTAIVDESKTNDGDYLGKLQITAS